MKCTKCNIDNPDGVKFCGECGTKVENRMPCRQGQALRYHRTSSFPASGDPVPYPLSGSWKQHLA